MSGGEVIVVLGVIASVISILDGAKQIIDAAQDVKGLHEAFRKVAENIPLVLCTLKKVQQVLRMASMNSPDTAHKMDIDHSAKEVRPVFESCQTNANALYEIFKEVVPADEDSRLERYKKVLSTVAPGKKRKVEDLMKETLEKLQLLHLNHFFETAVSDMGLVNAIKELDAVESSLPDDEEGKYVNTGSGPQNIHEGSGEQYNNTISGGERNVQYVAKHQTFGGPPSETEGQTGMDAHQGARSSVTGGGC
ncbi:hypothetical protein B0A48_00685 [Cryoendolithus antarcticus]|uniref:NACHT-NTPase and P-loop NTPases N-terminal domain-containing protein n=1 Tax=Cryoendolithus antarcticus TaxID=1507870 RepID=A0A1V8TVU4_9PEZI|nr:hypothetical protein B0A48_00685 [Cryoendolithus antarcticus]